MKLLLTAINAKYIHSNLAVYNLKACAGAFGSQVELAEFTINHRIDYILQEIYKRKPDVLCFSCYIWNYEYVKEIADEFHRLCPDVPVWFGGPEVSYEIPLVFKENPCLTGVMIGEGEVTFWHLASHYCTGEPALSAIRGIAFCSRTGQDRGDYVMTPPAELVDLDAIPFYYRQEPDDFANRILYYESSRGCPFSCSYCLSSIDKKLRFRDLALVKEDLLFFIEKEVPQVKFVDRTFNCRHEHAIEIWQFIKDHDRGITNFHFEIAADLLTEDEITLLSSMRPGLVQLEIGVQSTNPQTIEEIHRVMHLPQVFDAVKRIQDVGNIHEHLDLIAGLPYEDFDRFAQSFRDIYAWKPDQLQLGFLKVLKGSYIYDHRDEYGLIYKSKPPYEVMATNWLSYDEVLAVKLVVEMLEVYYNSGQYEVTLKLLEVVYPDSFGFFLELGKFYERKGYLDRSHTRIRRCEILMEYIREDGKFPMDLLQEALLYDLYCRENLKSRPSWAEEIPGYAKIARVFCKKGKQNHIEPFSYAFPKREQKQTDHLPEKRDTKIYIWFDYENRDILNHQAMTKEISEEEVEKQCRQQNG